MLRLCVIASLVILGSVYGQHNHNAISCPRCTDAYDPNSCTETQTCHSSHDVCEFHVHTAQNNRIEYVCHNSHACTNHEVHGCDPTTNEKCTYCCGSVSACKTQRDQLFSVKYTTGAATTAAPAATTAAPGATTAAPAATTAAPAATTAAPAATTAAPAATTAAPAGTTMAPATTVATSQATAATTNPNMCISCGDLGTNTDCSTTDLILGSPNLCPSAQPYCFSYVRQNGTDAHIVKGCADQAFCKADWWQSTSPKTECRSVDISVPSVLDCTFCCDGNACNTNLRPDDVTLLTFQP